MRRAASSFCGTLSSINRLWASIVIDAVRGKLDVELSAKELAARRKKWKPRRTDFQSGALWRYAQTVGPAYQGAVVHPGGKAETHTYGDI